MSFLKEVVKDQIAKREKDEFISKLVAEGADETALIEAYDAGAKEGGTVMGKARVFALIGINEEE